MNKKRSIIGLMGALLINNILYMFINTFMVAYFYTLTNYNYKIISVFYIMSFIFIAITTLALGKIIKNKMQVPIFRLGIILYFKSMLSNILKIIFPFIFGTSIELNSFSNVALMVLILSIIQFSFSLCIKEKDLKDIKRYDLKGFIKYLSETENVNINNFYKIMFYEGIVNYLLKTLITILIVMTFKTNISLGILTTVFSFCSIFSVYIFQRRLKNNNLVLKLSTIMIVLSVLLLLFNINKITVIIYNLINSIFLILLINNAEEKRYSIINEDKIIIKDYLAEHQVISEISLNISRIIGYIILFIISLFNNIIYFKLLLIFITIGIIYYSKLMVKIQQSNIQNVI